MPPYTSVISLTVFRDKTLYMIIMKTNLREWLTRYQCFVRPKVHFAPDFSFNAMIFNID